ncbi:23S rRNA (adenine(2030)-N(6))-methyltransferase RlmJ [Terricaulis sp.]|uniref:23S rRNA (adenine(2030)-N(6))-methyltransferase RlmJ n=1 Tax=Terricaulis sp. TaxID=2768686 RepID=UPI003783A38D
MNYRHAFHAGNHADVLKHVALLYCLDALKRKETPFGVLDTHAGRGLYDLFGDEAMRSPEWRQGLGKLIDCADTPPPVARYLDALKARNLDGVLRYYPGSPALVADTLREQDTLTACELHPEEFSELRRHVHGPNVRLHERDAYEGMRALLPPAERRGLVLIDPPYEEPDELTTSARAIAAALQRFGHGMYLWWRPLKSRSALDAADAEIRHGGGAKWLRADLWVGAPAPEGRLMGSSIFLINPPYGLRAMLDETLPALARRMKHDDGFGASVSGRD